MRVLFAAAAASFLLGDLTTGLGTSVVWWCVGAAAAGFPIPLVWAAATRILYDTVPSGMIGRVFAVRNAVQSAVVPPAILLGGVLADFVFEPWIRGDHPFARFLHHLVGSDPGSGMAAMFLTTGVLGTVACLVLSRHRGVRALDD